MNILARLRVPLGFLCAVAAYWLARPTPRSIWMGMSIAALGEVLRLWAAGHIEKGREVTRSGPYQFIAHPLYLGSAIMGGGFIVAARSWLAATVVVAYLGATLTAAMRTEEATLDARFEGEYAAYRAGVGARRPRPFSVARVMANREYRAVLGWLAAVGLLVLRMTL
jgi:protein-S-isoprenylcysteine O-methyltransferase Ste14